MKITAKGICFQNHEAINYVKHTDELVRNVAEIIHRWNSPYEVFELTTSGSTGAPKTIGHHRDYLEWLSNQTRMRMQLENDERVACCLPLNKAGGFMMLARSLTFGWDIEITEPTSNPMQTLRELPTFISLVPYQLEKILETEEGRNWLNQIPHVLLGGSALHATSLEPLAKRKSPAFIGYGMTETAGHIALKTVGCDFDVTPYQPFDGVLFSLKDDFIVIDIPAFKMHLETRDKGVLKDGELLLTGRSEELLNSGGLKILANELESHIQNYFAIHNTQVTVVVFGMQDERFGQTMAVVFEGFLPDAEEIEHCKIYLAAHIDKRLIPQYWFEIQQIPRTNLKPDRLRLAEFFSPGA